MSDGRRTLLRDREAFLAFYDASVDDAYRYAGRLCGADRAAAEDLVHDAYMRLLRGVQEGRNPEVNIGYVVTTIRNLHLDQLRRRTMAERRLHLVATPGTTDGEAPFANDVSTLAALPERDRTALVLRYVDGLSVTEVATVMEITVHAAESLLARARARLRNQEASHG